MRYGKIGNVVQRLDLSKANRHGLIAGATGTGKTVTLQTLAEGFSRSGVPVFCADIKGDLSGIADGNNAVFWDLFGEQGHQIRTSVESMGPALLSRMMELTKVQEGVLNVAFKYAEHHGISVVTMRDLRELLTTVADKAKFVSARYGNVTVGSIGAIQRHLTMFENEGGELFLNAPSFDIMDLIQTKGGQGQINILAADVLSGKPKIYSTFLLWLLNELFRRLPEAGDLHKPKLVFFFDEAHLLFSDGSKALEDMIERVVRLIRSKGDGVYFVTQSPTDVPDRILAQLGNRFQHALRAFSPRDLRALRTAAQTFRPNPAFDTAETISALPTGFALVSTLDKTGTPSIVQRVKIDLPGSALGPISGIERLRIVTSSGYREKYPKIDAPSEVYQQETAKRDLPLWVTVLVYAMAFWPVAPLLLLAFVLYQCSQLLP